MKILILLFITLILISNVSALEFDNTIKYSKQDKLVEIDNSFGLPIIGTKIGSVELTSHSDVSKPIFVSVGKDKIVMTYQFKEFNSIYENGIGDIEFTDMNTNKIINLDYHLEEITYETYQVPIQKLTCLNPLDKEDCISNSDGFITETRIKERKEFKSKDIPDKDITLALVVDVRPNDYIDAKWTIAGKKLSRHASWNTALENGLIGVYNFNETSGGLIERFKGVNNLSVIGSGQSYSVATTKLPNSITFLTTSGFKQATGQQLLQFASSGNNNSHGIFNGTIVAWIKSDSDSNIAVDNFPWSSYYTGTGSQYYRYGSRSATTGILISGCDASTIFRDDTTQWWVAETEVMATFTWDAQASIYRFYINNTLVNSSSTAVNMDNCNQNAGFYVGATGDGTTKFAGEIIDIKVYNRTLSSTEINEHYNAGDGLEYYFIPDETINIGVALTSPSNGASLNTQIINFSGNFNITTYGNLTNTTLQIWNVSNNLVASNFTLVNGTTNSTSRTLQSFSAGTYQWNYLTCGINSTSSKCSYAPSNYSFTFVPYNVTVVTYNTTALESSNQSFKINLTLSVPDASPSIKFVYDNVNYGVGTESGNSTDRTSTISVIAPTVSSSTNKTFYWNITTNGQTVVTTSYNQTVEPINLSICSGSNNVPYLNITFKDEVSLLNINASIPSSTFTYYLTGGSSSNKTYNYASSSNLASYAFCFTPSNQNVTIDTNLDYKQGTDYPQRTWNPDPTVYSNATTNQVLYLLSSSDGVYANYQVFSGSGQTLSGVLVSAVKEGSLVAEGLTDDSGSISLWLDPTTLHTITFSLAGYDTEVFDLYPSTETRTIVLGSTETSSSEIIDYTRGITITILPIAEYLSNHTTYNFTYSLSTNYWATIDSFGFYIQYANGSNVSVQTSTASTGGILSSNVNTLNSSRMTMYYYYVINSTRTTQHKTWIVDVVGNYGLTNFFNRLSTYIDSDIYGVLGTDGTGNFSKAFLSFFILIMVGGVLSYKYGVTSEPAIIGVLFGLVLFLDSVNLLPNPVTPMRVPFGEFLAFILAIICIAFIAKEEMR